LKLGTAGKKSRPRYRRFAAAVRSAVAQARLRAEARVLNTDPKRWLIQGPGRDRPHCPGWSGVVRPTEEADERSPDLLSDPATGRLLARLAEALAPFPEARKVVADMLQDNDVKNENPGFDR
jgi:hypothetical protein